MTKPHKHPHEGHTSSRRSIPVPPPKTRVILEEQERRDQEIDKSLQAIYVDNQPTSDFTRLERSSSWHWLRLLCGVVCFMGVLTMAAWAGLVWLQPLESRQMQQLQIRMEGPQEITLGEEETFVVSWENTEMQTISRTQIRLGFPQDFIPTDIQPPSNSREHFLWDLGLVPARQQGKIQVKGIFLGTLGKEQAWQAIGTYRTNNSVRDAQTLVTKSFVYARTALEGTLAGESRVIAGDPYLLTYQLRNSSSRALDQLMLRVAYPEGFVPSATSTISEVGGVSYVTFPIPQLVSQATHTIRILGSFRPSVSGETTFGGEVGKQSASGGFVPLHTTGTRVTVLAGDLNIRTIVNSADAERSIAPGDLLRVTVAYQNTSPERIKDIVLTLGFETTMNGISATGTSLLDWTKLEDDQRGTTNTRSRLQTIQFDKTTVPAFAELAPQAEGTVEVSIPSLLVATGTKDAVIRVHSKAAMTLDTGGKQRRTVQTPPVILSYRTDADIKAYARYFTEEGAPIGVGPLPPTVGKATTYRLNWQVKKTLHGLNDLVIQGVLPSSVVWTNRALTEAGTMTYDSGTRTVRWEINKMPENVEILEASFDIELTPQSVDVGRFATLLERISFTARDALTNERISRVAETISTDLENDEGARGKGVVKK